MGFAEPTRTAVPTALGWAPDGNNGALCFVIGLASHDPV